MYNNSIEHQPVSEYLYMYSYMIKNIYTHI